MQGETYNVKNGRTTLGKYLFNYLRDQGIRHCFGLPGDYILPLFNDLEQTPGIDPVVATHEPGAAFAADAYARLNGLGVLLLTYGVGGFNAMNGVAGAYAESSPLLVISGGPPSDYQKLDYQFQAEAHHLVKHAGSQLEAFKQVTVKSIRIQSAADAALTIHSAVHTARIRQLPVYLEIPIDLMQAPIVGPERTELAGLQIDYQALEAAIDYFTGRIHQARHPVIYAGVEAGRFHLQKSIRDIKEKRHIPVVTSILGKGLLNESEAGVLGVYAGVLSQDKRVRQIVESSDLVLMIGVKITDVNCGAFTAKLTRDRLLIAKSDWIGDGFMNFKGDIPLESFVRTLAKKILRQETVPYWPQGKPEVIFQADNLMDRYLKIINTSLTRKNIVIADTGDSCYGSLFLQTRRDYGYLAPTFYNTMGFAVPAALGAQLAQPKARPVILVGDGAFRMTGLEVSTILKWQLNPVIILFNNDGYGMQRIFMDGAFNDLPMWDYEQLTRGLGISNYRKVENSSDFEVSFKKALKRTKEASVIEAVVPKGVISTGLKTFGQALDRDKKGICPLNRGKQSCSVEQSCAFCRASIWL